MEGFGEMQGISDEVSVEIDKSNKQLDFGHIPGGWPVLDARNLDQVHLNTTFQKDKTKVFNHNLFKHEFLHLEVETVFPEDVEDPYHNHMIFIFGLVAKNEYVFFLDGHNSLIYEFLEDVIHHCLKGRKTVHEAK